MKYIIIFIGLFMVSVNTATAQPYKGFMLNPYRFEGMHTDVIETSNIGANIYRYFIVYPAPGVVETWDADTYRQFLISHMHLIDSILPTIAQQQAKLVIDLHTPPCGVNKDNTHVMFNNLDCLGQFYGAWDILSKHYAHNPHVIAYDILNEPATKNYKYWNSIVRTVSWLIRNNDPFRVVVVESAYGNPLLINKLEPYLYNTWYSAHIYCKGSNTSISQLNKVVQFQRKYRAFIYLGEVGCETYKPSAAKFLDKLLGSLKKNNISWSYHSFREAYMWNPEGTPSLNVLRKYLLN